MKKGKARLDQVVENAGTKLAGVSRRGFLGKVAGTTTAVLFGGSVILGESREAEAGPYAGCYWANEINIGFWPNVTTNLPAGNYLWPLRGPDWGAPNVYKSDGSGCYFNNGDILGHYVKSDSSCAPASCPIWYNNPSSGTWYWVWGPAGTNGNQSGWVHSAYVAEYSASCATSVCGPAGAQYDMRCPGGNNCYNVGGTLYGGCMRGTSPCRSATGCNYDGCNQGSAVGFTASAGYVSVRDQGNNWLNSCQYYKIRFNPNGHAFGYVIPGDKLRTLGRTGWVNGAIWHCVYAWNCRYLPNGCRGWVASQSDGSGNPPSVWVLENLSSQPGSGNGVGMCPCGSQY